MSLIVPSATEVQKARELLKKYLQPTRLVRAESLERRSKGQVHLKIESDLPTGSFKPRGALFALLTNAEQGTLPESSRQVPVITAPRSLMRHVS